MKPHFQSLRTSWLHVLGFSCCIALVALLVSPADAQGPFRTVAEYEEAMRKVNHEYSRLRARHAYESKLFNEAVAIAKRAESYGDRQTALKYYGYAQELSKRMRGYLGEMHKLEKYYYNLEHSRNELVQKTSKPGIYMPHTTGWKPTK